MAGFLSVRGDMKPGSADGVLRVQVTACHVSVMPQVGSPSKQVSKAPARLLQDLPETS